MNSLKQLIIMSGLSPDIEVLIEQFQIDMIARQKKGDRLWMVARQNYYGTTTGLTLSEAVYKFVLNLK